MEHSLLSPKVDFVLKELMARPNVLKGFLSAVLKIPFENITEAILLNTYLRKMHKDDKLGILDVRICLNGNIEVDIEIQVVEFKCWAERSLFYLAKLFSDQIRENEPYSVLKKCVNISILDFNLFKDTDNFYSVFHLREDTRHSLYTDKIEFHIIELPKLPEEMNETDSLLYWSKFINAKSEEEFEMLATKDPFINEAVEELKKISQDRDKREEYWAREKALRDYIYFANEAEAAQKAMEEAQKATEEAQKATEEAQKATEEAQKANQEANKKIALLEEITDQAKREKIQTIKKLAQLNLSANDIALAVNLTVDEVNQILLS